MPSKSTEYEIVWLIRRLFQALAQKSNDGLQALGISVADRAVLEFLYPEEKLSVPEIAARYQVSRQHVQVTVNRLLDAGLATTRDNPRHKRSPHVVLTSSGVSLFGKIRKQDLAAIKNLFAKIPKRDRLTTRKTLETLLTQLR